METVIIKVGDTFHKHYFNNEQNTEITIGRAFDNDIILTDPYIGQYHLKLLNASGDNKHDWHVKIIDTTNPVFHDKQLIEETELNIKSGDSLTIGRTTLSVYSENHAVAKTREFSFTNWLHHHKFKPLIASFMLSLLFAASLFNSYLETTYKPDWGDLSTTAIGMAITAVIWTIAWSIAGLIIKTHHYFFSQLFFTSLVFILFLISDNLFTYIDYMFNSISAGEIFNWVTTILLTGLLIGFNIALLTYSPGAFRKGMVTSMLLWGFAAALTLLYEEDYSSDPEYSSTIKPSYIPTKSPVSVDGYMKSYDHIFEKLSKTESKNI